MEENLEIQEPIVTEQEEKDSEEIETPTEEETKKILEESILNSIKKMLGPSYDDDGFDTDIIIHINSTFTTLRQLGIGPEKGYRISSPDNKWSEFIKDDEMLDSVKTYIYLKVKLIFDPPLNGTLYEAFERQIKELEWRLNVSIESDPIGGDSYE